jgi:hypothetical protein
VVLHHQDHLTLCRGRCPDRKSADKVVCPERESVDKVVKLKVWVDDIEGYLQISFGEESFEGVGMLWIHLCGDRNSQNLTSRGWDDPGGKKIPTSFMTREIWDNG